jgi:hypothetical protein
MAASSAMNGREVIVPGFRGSRVEGEGYPLITPE